MTLSSKESRLWIEYVVVKPINTMEQMNTAVRKFTKSLSSLSPSLRRCQFTAQVELVKR